MNTPQRRFMWTRGMVLALFAFGFYRNRIIFYEMPHIAVAGVVVAIMTAYILRKQYHDLDGPK